MVGPSGENITADDVQQGLDYIAQHPEITEVILTGGDPLVLAPAKLQAIMQRLHNMPHVQWVRFHTRLPVVQPNRVNEAMLQALKGPKQIWLAVHVNHVAELTVQAVGALQRLQQLGVQLLSQSVLLQGINNNIPALRNLFMRLTTLGVKPYYLHHPDLTAGTSHFRLSFEDGMALMAELQQTMSSLSLPRYVVDIPGGVAEKVPVTPHHVVAVAGQVGHYKIRDFAGVWHDYSDVL
jgi:lysine 2,3-aminomutase